MLKIDIITVFPELFTAFSAESLILRAQKKRLLKLNCHQLRDFTDDRHKTVDDKPFGGGRGMLLKIEPIYKALKAILTKTKTKSAKTKVILFTPRGQRFSQIIAAKLAKTERLVLICGRYEGVDERVAKNLVDLELSLGDFVLMGGEVPAMALAEAVTRLLPGVLGNSELLPERFVNVKLAPPARNRHFTRGQGFIEYPQYTRPELFYPLGKKSTRRAWAVPKVLLSGDHRRIAQWRQKHSRIIA